MTHRVSISRAVCALALALVTAGCTGTPARAPSPTPRPEVAPGPALDPGPARELRGTSLDTPTGLRILVEGSWYDADTGAGRANPVNAWLRPVAGPPVMLVEPPPVGDRTGTVRLTRVDAGTLRVVEAVGPYRLAPSVDGRGVWASEYRSRTSCVLRELTLEGRTRRAARPVPCGVEPVLETPAGLWVSRWVNVFTLAGRTVEFNEPTYALLDPRTLREKASYPEVVVAGAYHVLTMDDQQGNLVLRDLRRGTAVPLAKPSEYSFFVFNAGFPLGRVSPDGRYAALRLGSHSMSPQVIDVWVLDLTNGAWLHVPGMPVQGALKYTREEWAPDGRLVLLGQYGRGQVLATWRPGDTQLAVRPDRLPETLYEQGLGLMLITS